MTDPDASARDRTPSRHPRRGVLLGAAGLGIALAAGGGHLAFNWFNLSGDVGEAALSVEDAHRRARAGEILLIDIRRPDEWAATGIPAGAIPLDMRQPDFAHRLADLRRRHGDLPVALICARGVRSRRLTNDLEAVGMTGLLDVPEGMLGSGAGPGWLRAGLPVTPL